MSLLRPRWPRILLQSLRHVSTSSTPFEPRSTFPSFDNIPRSYFLGHHKAGLDKMKTMLSSIDMVFECRDYRVPLTSRNPLFEDSLGHRPRVIVYTKKDLGTEDAKQSRSRDRIIKEWHKPYPVLFANTKSPDSVRNILKFAKEQSNTANNLLGTRMMVVGMPNVGKSSLLNALRRHGINKGKAARTGAQPGITRKIASSVKIVEGSETEPAIFLVDTPGVFIPYVPDAEAMMKLALCGNVKDTVIAPTILADYLLFHINVHDPGVYGAYCPPTNDVNEFLTTLANHTGRLMKGGVPDLESVAIWFIQRWREGHMGRFILDDIALDSMEKNRDEDEFLGSSISQARKQQRIEQAKKRATRA